MTDQQWTPSDDFIVSIMINLIESNLFSVFYREDWLISSLEK